MQRFERIPATQSARAVLLAAWASAASFACSSDHRLGDLTPVDLSEGPEGDEGTASTRDFVAPAELGPPDFSIGESTFVYSSYVTSVGDVDGDGFGDFAARNMDGVGYVHLRYGGPRPIDATDVFAFAEGGVRLIQENPDELVIESISALGDVDGDGFADFLVGLMGCKEVSSNAYLFYGGPERLDGVAKMVDVGVLLSGPPATSPSTRYCEGLADWRRFTAGLGDFDGDGFDDFVLTVPQPNYYDPPEVMALDREFATFEGELVYLDNVAYVFYGRAERIASGTPWLSADARLSAPQQLGLVPTGDINADGLPDLILGAFGYHERVPPPQPSHSLSAGYFWLPGRAQRLEGDLELVQAATSMLPRAEAVGDLDGDGVRDVLLYDDSNAPRFFYGAAGLFDAGADFALADATFQPYTGEFSAKVIAVQDRDGDGDDELVSSFSTGEGLGYTPQNVALLSGSSSRLSGAVELPEPTNPLWERWGGGHHLEGVFSVGDLDGDGVGDIITRAGFYGAVVDPPENPNGSFVRVDGVMYERDSAWEAQLNIHYGTPGELAAPPR
jgi:hypothetical protein